MHGDATVSVSRVGSCDKGLGSVSDECSLKCVCLGEQRCFFWGGRVVARAQNSTRQIG